MPAHSWALRVPWRTAEPSFLSAGSLQGLPKTDNKATVPDLRRSSTEEARALKGVNQEARGGLP